MTPGILISDPFIGLQPSVQKNTNLDANLLFCADAILKPLSDDHGHFPSFQS